MTDVFGSFTLKWLLTLSTLLFVHSAIAVTPESFLELIPTQASIPSGPVKSRDEMIFDQIGRDFEYEIPNFKSFWQQRMYWCWAAVVETIYFNQTGAHLDQHKLARMNFSLDNYQSNHFLEKAYPKAKKWNDLFLPDLETNCEGSEGNEEQCDHPGDSMITLSRVGDTLPLNLYRTDEVAILKALKESLIRGVPAGYSQSSDAGDGHGYAVRGAKFMLDRSGSIPQLRVFLTVADPYWPAEWGVPEKLLGYKLKRQLLRSVVEVDLKKVFGNSGKDSLLSDDQIFVADYQTKSVSSSACAFLTEKDHERFCQ